MFDQGGMGMRPELSFQERVLGRGDLTGTTGDRFGRQRTGGR
jgi:hypothetical protein